jgi:hypothetical protein
MGLQDYSPVEAMMRPNDDFLSAPELDYDGFRAAMREDWGWYRRIDHHSRRPLRYLQKLFTARGSTYTHYIS